MADLEDLEHKALEKLDGFVFRVDLTKQVWIPFEEKVRIFQNWLNKKLKEIFSK